MYIKNMKYKLIKKYPGSPEIGTVIEGTTLFSTMDGETELKLYSEFWQKFGEPVFTTEDGKEIFEGDEYYYIVISKIEFLDPWKVKYHRVNWNNPNKPPLGYVQFSTKEAAEKYIYENMPVFSRKEIIDFVSKNAKSEELDTYFCTAWIDAEKLFNFINSKKE